MNKNLPENKTIKSQTSFNLKSTIANKPVKSKQIKKSNERNKTLEIKNNKIQNKIKIKQCKKLPNNISSHNINKNNVKAHSRTKSNPKQNQQKNTKTSSSRNNKKIEKITDSNFSYEQHNKNKINTKINIFSQPSPFEKNLESDKNNFIQPAKNIIKINIRKVEKNPNIKNEDLNDAQNYENYKFISLMDTSSLYNALQNSSLIYKIFEEKLLKKNGFEINKNTLEIETKNAESCQELKEQKFWILYAEYLIKNNLLVNEKQFLSVINEAFSYMESDCPQLRTYYLEKIKKYAPCYLSDGSLDESDDVYLNKLNKSAASFIKRQKEFINSNIKLKSNNKIKAGKIIIEVENKKKNINDENKAQDILKNKEICIQNKQENIEEHEFEIINNP